METVVAVIVLIVFGFVLCAVYAGFKEWRRTARRQKAGKHSIYHGYRFQDGDLLIIEWAGMTEEEWKALSIVEKHEVRNRFFNAHGL